MTYDTFVTILTDLIFCIMFPIFYSSVLSMRFGKLKYFIVCFIAMLFIFDPIVYTVDMPQYAMFFSGIVMMLGLLFIFSNDKPLKIIVCLIIPYAVNIATSMIYLAFRSVFMPDIDIVFGYSTILDTIIMYGAMVPPLYYISKKFSRKKIEVRELSSIYTLSIIPIQMALLTFIMYIYQQDIDQRMFMIGLTAYLVTFSVITFLVIRRSASLSRKQSRMQFMSDQYELLSSQYNELHSSYISYRRLRHDLKEHIQIIDTLLSKGETKELSDYTKKLTDDWNKLSSRTFCDVPAVDIVLADKYNSSVSMGIKTEFSVSGIKESGADRIYLCSIFANLLNNALEAAANCSKTPYISLNSGIRINYLVIKCENSIPDTIKEKENPDEHGYGLGIVENLCSQLGGDFTHSSDDNKFTAIARILIQESTKGKKGKDK